MAQDGRTHKRFEPGKRKARGFLPAGSLIAAQMRTAQAKRGFAQVRLQALWPDIVGREVAALCAPVKLTPARGPSGNLLKLAVSSAHAPKLQMMLPQIRDRVNATLGPGTVARIQLVHSGGFGGSDATEARRQEATRAVPPPDSLPEPMRASLSSIGDHELRDALQTLARNVLSRTTRL